MPANLRIFYAVESIGIAECGTSSYTMAHGLQSIGITTKFNLEQVFEIGQLSLYENIENIPDVEVTLAKVCDGYAPLYLLATKNSASASLTGRSNKRATVGLSIYPDTSDSASGTAVAQAIMSGMYVSALSYTLPTNGNCTEDVTLVGNNKIWSSFTATAFTNTDEPLAIAGSGGVNRREDVLFGEQAGSVSRLPADIPGISASGYNPYNTTLQTFGAHIQQIKVSTNLGREQLFELGKRGPYHRYATFPVEVTTEFETISIQGDQVQALEESTSNLTNRTIKFYLREGLVIDLGTRNKLSNITYGGANAGQNGGNATETFTYTNFNDMIVQHPQDPTAALRP